MGKMRMVSGLVGNFMNTSCADCYLGSSRIMDNRLKLHVIYTLERFVHSKKTHSPCRFCKQLEPKVFLGYWNKFTVSRSTERSERYSVCTTSARAVPCI